VFSYQDNGDLIESVGSSVTDSRKILLSPIFENFENNDLIESLQLSLISIQTPYEYWLALAAYRNKT
jgi:hypothetical protein